MATRALETPKKVQWKVEPRHKWVLVRERKKEEVKTEGGVVVPGQDFFMSSAKGEPSSRGEVVAMSAEVDLEVGDFVIFTNFGTKLEDIDALLGDENLRLVRDEEIYARVVPCV